MNTKNTCPYCTAPLSDGTTCETYFHQMLFWEAEWPELGVVHHLMVLAYHLQHPHLYAPEGLEGAKDLLVRFVQENHSPQSVRNEIRDRVDSGKRDWHVTSRNDARASYTHRIQWTVTAADVVSGGSEKYVENTRKWAKSILEALKQADELD